MGEAERANASGANPEPHKDFKGRNAGRMLAARAKRSSNTLARRTPGGRGVAMEYY